MDKLFFLALFVCSCVAPVEDTSENETDSEDSKESPGYSSDYPKDSGPYDSCYSYHSSVVLEGPDGESRNVKIPAECNPYYFDKGDPSPDDKPSNKFHDYKSFSGKDIR